MPYVAYPGKCAAQLRVFDFPGPRHLRGCVVMRRTTVKKLYDQIPEGNDGGDPVTEIQLEPIAWYYSHCPSQPH